MRHWELRSQAYLALAPQLTSWRLDAGWDTVLRPDALLSLKEVDTPIALEADTGTEHRRQWLKKLAAYQKAPPPVALLVAARGSDDRLRQLAKWLDEASPVPWSLAAADRLTTPLSWTVPDLIAPFQRPIPRAAGAAYVMNGVPIDPDRARRLITSGNAHLTGRERRRGGDILYLAPGPKPREVQSFSQNRQEFP